MMMEGTLFMHIDLAMKQDQELGAEYLRFFKDQGSTGITPFNITLLLSVARISRFHSTLSSHLVPLDIY